MRLKTLVKLYQSGWTLRKIARRYGVSHQWIYMLLQRAGIKFRRKGYKKVFLPQRVQAIIESYKICKSLKICGEAFRISTTLVKRILKENDIDIKPKGQMPDSVVLEQARRLLELGVSKLAIAKILGFNRQTIYYWDRKGYLRRKNYDGEK